MRRRNAVDVTGADYAEIAVFRSGLSSGSDLPEGNVVRDVVLVHSVAHTVFHAADLVAIVGATILEPAGVIAVETALIFGFQTAPPVFPASVGVIIVAVKARG